MIPKRLSLFSLTLNWYLILVDVTFFEFDLFFAFTNTKLTPEFLDIPSVIVHIELHIAEITTAHHSLQVYNRRLRPPIEIIIPLHTADDVIVNSSSRPAPSLTMDPSFDSPLPIAIRKCINSTRNPSPHYVILSYHLLSSSIMIVCLFCLLCQFLNLQKMFVLTQDGNKQWWTKWMSFKIVALRN